MKKSKLRDQTGMALLSVVTILALLLPLVAHTVMQSHLDLLLARNFRDQTEASYIAEAGLDYALAHLDRLPSLPRLLAGPDTIRDSADDGEFPLPLMPGALGDGRSFTVHVASTGADKAEIVSSGRGRHGAVKSVAALIEAGDTPFTPAALLIEGAPRAIVLNPVDLDIAGQDASGTEAAVASWTFSAATSDIDWRQVVGQLAQSAGALHLAVDPPPTSFGTPTSPQLSVVDSDFNMEQSSSGAGILVINGSLRITATLRFDGLLIVLGALETSLASELQITGAVWHLSDSHPTICNGRGFVRYSSAALALAEQVGDGLLPRALHARGRRDVS